MLVQNKFNNLWTNTWPKCQTTNFLSIHSNWHKRFSHVYTIIRGWALIFITEKTNIILPIPRYALGKILSKSAKWSQRCYFKVFKMATMAAILDISPKWYYQPMMKYYQPNIIHQNSKFGPNSRKGFRGGISWNKWLRQMMDKPPQGDSYDCKDIMELSTFAVICDHRLGFFFNKVSFPWPLCDPSSWVFVRRWWKFELT